MIRNLIFDMGGVVFLQDSAEAFRRFREAGVDPAQYMGDYGQRGFFLDLEEGRIGRDEFCRRMAEAAGRSVVPPDEAMHCWMGFVTGVPAERLSALLELKEKYHVCLLSNTNPFVMSYMRSAAFSGDGHGIAHYFHSLFCSYELRACKPGAEIFRKALAADGMRAGECIFVDDSAKNVAAAESVGMRGLHVATNADWREPLASMLRDDAGL